MIKVLVLTDFSSGYSRNLLKGIVRYSQQVGGWTFYRMPMYYRVMHGDRGVIEWARKWKADAIIAQLTDVDITLLLENLQIPVIVQNYRERVPGVCNLTGDYIGTGAMAADYFIAKGYTKFGYYGTEDTVWSRERGIWFNQRLAENGHVADTFFETSYTKAQWMYNPDALGAWLDGLPKPVAVFSCDDYFALQVSETCKIKGFRVPEDVAVLGVDNDELLCNISNPPLSSIAIDSENGGYNAAKVLHELVAKKITDPQNIIIRPVQILTRQSTQQFVISDKYVMRAIEYIEKHHASSLSVPEILKQLPLSRRVFEKRFKGNTGLSVYQFIQQVRVDRFAAELITTKKSIGNIAASCGFEDAKNVARVFVNYRGMTPSEYRKTYRQTDPSDEF